MVEKIVIHHIPKTGGSSIQMRLLWNEVKGKMPRGTTLIKYHAVGREWEYSLLDDLDFSKRDPLHDQFIRHRGKQEGWYADWPTHKKDKVKIITGHSATVNDFPDDRHIVIVRNPIWRDASHYNYDTGLGRTKYPFKEWIQNTETDYQVRWIYHKILLHTEIRSPASMLDSIKKAKLKFYRSEGVDKDFWNHFCAANKLTTHGSVKDNVTPREWRVMDQDYANKVLVKNHKAMNVYDWALWNSLV